MTSFDQNKETQLIKGAMQRLTEIITSNSWKPMNRRQVGCQFEEVNWADYNFFVKPKRNRQ